MFCIEAMIDILELVAAAISFNVCVKVFIMVCIMTTTRFMIEGIMAITIEMMFHHIGHVIEMIKSVRKCSFIFSSEIHKVESESRKARTEMESTETSWNSHRCIRRADSLRRKK